MRRALLMAALATIGCQPGPEPAGRLDEPTAAATGAEAAAEADGEVFGAAPDGAMPITPLADIVAAPDRYRDRVVRTEGTVARVCQRMGCWMELRDGEGGPAVRVPMAGHAFFLPRDAAGRRATMQGRVHIESLSPEHRAHLESEGALATASALSIEATGVALDQGPGHR